MLTGILIAIATGLSWTLVGIIMTRISKHGLNPNQYFGLNYLFSVLFSLVFLSRYKDFAAIDGGHAILCSIMIGSGLFTAAGMLVLQKSMKLGHNGIAWSIGQSAIILPFLSGILIFAQKGTLFQYAGALLILGGMAIPSLNAKGKSDVIATKYISPWIVLAFAAFVLLGVAQTLQSIPSYWKGWIDHGNMRPALFYLGGFAGAVLFAVPTRVNLFAWEKKTWAYASVMALFNLITIKLTFICLDLLSEAGVGSIGYPLLIGSCIAGFSFYSLFIIKEESHPANWIGLGLTLAGIAAMTL